MKHGSELGFFPKATSVSSKYTSLGSRNFQTSWSTLNIHNMPDGGTVNPVNNHYHVS